jgi:hypothetical protein|nr:MAG TPA: Head Tail Connector Protein [Bacteriophage sp.]
MAWGETALPLVKANLNITQNVRDEYLTAIINGVVEQLQNEQGLALDEADPYHLQFVVDFSAWRYRGRGEDGPMPQNLRFRLNNLMIHNGGDSGV